MPNYDYECPKCGKIKEFLHRVVEDPIIFCEDLNCITAGKMIKKISCGNGIHFKGSGFYETDYKGR